MNFRRKRTPSPWLVQDIYLRDNWGSPFNPSRARRWSLRRVFVTAMLLFAIVDVCLVTFFAIAYFFPPRAVNTAQRNPTRVAKAVAVQPTATAPNSTPPPPPTLAPTVAPTKIPATNSPPRAAPTQVAIEPTAPARTMAIELPATLNLALAVEIPNEPQNCTPADAMPDVVERSIKLCGAQEYRPFTVRGENIGVFGDKSSVIRSQGRSFGITAEGNKLWIQNVLIRGSTDALDTNTFLCLYPDCSFRKGGTGGAAYGGGILVRASETTVMDSDIAGGIVGVAAEHVRGLKLINNRLDDSSGWGSYNFAVAASYFVGNTFSRDNRSCTTDAGYLPTGCESSGWVCIACTQNIIAKNFCTNSGNCYYMNGEGNLNSDNNRFHANECRAAPHNCFEVTFARGNEFVENTARDDPETGAACKYPFWIGGSQVIFARNHWNCEFTPQVALEHATASTHVLTKIEER